MDSIIDIKSLVGVVGVCFVLTAYGLLQLERLAFDGLVYNSLNAGGAALILYSLIFHFNLASFLIEIAWLSISLFGLTRALLRRMRTP